MSTTAATILDMTAAKVDLRDEAGDAVTIILSTSDDDITLTASDITATIDTTDTTTMTSTQDGETVVLSLTKTQTAAMGVGVWEWRVVYNTDQTTICKGEFELEAR